MKHLCRFLLVIVATLTLNLRVARAQIIDPKLNWLTLETPHFIIVYDSRHYWVAQQYAANAEQAYQALQPIFKEAPAKTTIVINDNTDLANGFSTQLPYPLIMTYPVLPSANDEIGDYGNWGLELITHEYTHTLNMEPVHGVAKPLSYIFGSIVKPNEVLPRWYLEGLAVEMETRYSHYGRLRSSNFLSAARAMVEEGTLRKEDISRANETDIPDWPGGMRPYLLGSLMWTEIISSGGDKAIYDLNQKYSRRVPGFLNGPIKDVLGIDWAQLLDRTETDTEKMAGAQIKVISTKPRPHEQRMPQDGFYSTSPVISPDGTKLVYVARTDDRSGIIELVERRGNESFASLKAKELVDDLQVDNIERMSWFPDSHSFVFNRINQLQPVDRYYTYSELYQYDMRYKSMRAITRHARAHEPVVSPDGRRVVFVENTPLGTRLSSVDTDGVDKDVRVLYTPPPQMRVSWPEFLSPTQLVFTERSAEGKEHFQLLNLQTQKMTEILQAYSPVHFPRLSKKGLLFISDRTGVANVYLWDKQGHVRALSNSTTRLESPELDAKTGDLIYSRLNGSGSALTTSTQNEWSKAAAEPPKVGAMVDYEWPHYDPPHVEFEATKGTYSTWPYLVPRYWIPYLAFDGSGVIIQGETAMSDPLGKQGYDLIASYDTYVHEPAFYGSYSNTELSFASIDVEADQYYDAISTGGINRSNTDALLRTGSFLPGLPNFFQGGLGWMFSRTSEGTGHVMRNGPQAYLQVFAAEKRGLEISPEQGGGAQLSHTQFIPEFGDIGYAREDIALQAYLSKKFWPLSWLPDRHVLFLSVNATVEPQLHSTALGVSSLSGYYQTETINPRYVMRGYDTGAFIGRNFVNGTAEYRFPIHYFYSGFGTKPLFIKRLHGAVFTDVATLDGDYYDAHVGGYYRTRLGRQYFMGTGAELRADTTVVYQMPLTIGLGLYYGVNRQAGPGSPVPYLTVGM